MDSLLAFWSHALGAVAMSTVLLWQLRGWAAGPAQKLLLGGLLTTATAAWLGGVSAGTMLAAHAETARNLIWVAMLFILSDASKADEGSGGRQRAVALVYGAVALVLGAQALVDSLGAFASPHDQPALEGTAIVLRTITAAGALVLVHNLYGQTAVASRGPMRLPMLGLALLWMFDLNLYTLQALHLALGDTLGEMRGIVVALAAPCFALTRADSTAWRPKLSRAATFQSLSLLAICSYFAIMALLAAVLRAGTFDWLRGLAILVLAGMTVALAVLLPSRRARSWTRVKIAKHFFEHRYDYRTEWLRFAATLGAGASSEPLAARIVRAFADILEAPAGLLIAPDDLDRTTVVASWQWPGRLPAPALAGDGLAALWPQLGDSRVLELDAHRYRWGSAADLALPVPSWMRDEQSLWVGIPLVHGETVVGLVLLAAPELRRPLDWEDYDLLRTAGRQAAASLSEAASQQRLGEAQRFDEFNRRFAFILHDIKNLVSQLKLLARNAERHADNPEWRADMVATLQGSVGKMTDLLARLAPAGAGQPRNPLRDVQLRPLLAGTVAGHLGHHDVRLLGDSGVEVIADPLGLEQALGHLLANAVEASPPAEPVTVRVDRAVDHARIEISDSGPGMDADFIANRLFAPFASTKEGGFGIGAFEARSLLHAMGGRLTVDSRPGGGTRFTISLPLAASESHDLPERLTA
ncbi:XrtA/PEP-CTERM system histidine kinase PrsK [Sphingomonas sp. LHG3406-1]|uniref:XrtA/PEP-CTERM system histidine kinase PrsK n=1 Tax=Sphingomonas sp. LHG3406-1 TaxID=2804617 RepID=UPI0026291D66|nr:XrtA/PEP-CTERM system histidine kinase PrsK [Sphingomonas sp. LHG3406-1]